MTPDETAATYAAAAAAKAFGTGAGYFQHGTHRQNTLEGHEHETPQVFLFDPRPVQSSQDSKVVRLDCTMYFVDAEPGDGDDPTKGEAAISRMSALKDRFFAHLDRNPLVDIQNIQWESVRQIYASRFTGVAVRFALVVPRPAGYALCEVPAEPEGKSIFDFTFEKPVFN